MIDLLVPGMVIKRLNGCDVSSVEDVKEFFVPRHASYVKFQMYIIEYLE